MAGDAGGIDALIDLLDEHREAVAYDWRTRFHLSPAVIGTDEMPWSEAVGHARLLGRDPSSALAASLEGWTHSISREALVLMDHFDLDHAINSKQPPKPHSGRPWKQDDTQRQRRGNAAGRTRDQVIAILRQFGHGEKVESNN